MMRYYIFILLIIVIVSCKKESQFDCFKSTGDIATETRSLSDFNKIIINDLFKINIIQDSIPFLNIKCGKNIIDLISTENDENTLTISNNNKCNWARKYSDIEINIHIHDIDTIIINGESTIISSDTLNFENLTVDVWSHLSHVDLILNSHESHLNVHAGTGDFIFRGYSFLSYLYSHGNPRLYANELTSSFTSVLTNSTGDIYVNATDVIHAQIESYGNIYYKGDPDITLTKSGEGNIIKDFQ